MRTYKPRTEREKDRAAALARAARLAARLAKVGLPAVVTDKLDQYGKPWYGQMPTDREMELLAEIFLHGAQAEAAECAGLSTETLKNHMTKLYGKLGATSGMQAAVLLGWLAFPRALVRPHRAPPPPVIEEENIVRF